MADTFPCQHGMFNLCEGDYAVFGFKLSQKVSEHDF